MDREQPLFFPIADCINAHNRKNVQRFCAWVERLEAELKQPGAPPSALHGQASSTGQTAAPS